MNAAISQARPQARQSNENLLEVSLMEEALDCDTAGTSLLQLLAALRQYHRVRDLSHQERFGAPDPQSQQALSQLEEVRQSLQALSKGADETQRNIRIEACLNLRMSAAN